MHIIIPFCGRDEFGYRPAIDTRKAHAIVDGPTADQMRKLVESDGEWAHMEEDVVFQTPGFVWRVVEVLGVEEHATLVDTWWFWGVVQTFHWVSGIEIYAIWSPENQRHCYLADYTHLASVLHYESTFHKAGW